VDFGLFQLASHRRRSIPLVNRESVILVRRRMAQITYDDVVEHVNFHQLAGGDVHCALVKNFA
jgi:hypothetical protein